jgi:alkylhydroperoxidase family enzyme
MTQRLQPLEPPYPPEVEAILARYPQRGGYLLALFRTFANSRRFLERGVANLLDEASPLPLRQREIVILRVTANLDCEYEWGVHVAAFARQAHLNEQQIAATRGSEASAPCWSLEEQSLIRAVDDICTEGRVGDMALPAFQQTWSLEQQLEILALCGAYHTVCFVANTARLAPEPFGARFPTDDSGP